MTLEPGEQSFLGATQWGLNELLLAISTSFLFPPKFYAYIFVDLVIKVFFYIDN